MAKITNIIHYVPRNKRNDEIKNYENINLRYAETERKGINKLGCLRYEFEIEYGKHSGFYNSDDISNFKECNVSSRVISQRLAKLNGKTGNFLTIEEAIKAPIDTRVKRNNNDLLKERLMVKQTEIEWFNENIKLMKPGSLHKQYRRMQSHKITRKQIK